MKLETARKLIPVAAALAAVFTLASLITQNSSASVSLYCAVLGLVFVAAMVALVFGGLKCPWCGKSLVRGGMKITRCPHCRRDLQSGLKTKKK